MDSARLMAWMQASQILVAAGVATVTQIRGLIAAMSPDVTDDDLNQIIDTVIADATRRKAQAEADARG